MPELNEQFDCADQLLKEGDRVSLATNICNEDGTILYHEGTKLVWTTYSDHQLINGDLVCIDSDDVIRWYS